MKTRVAWEREHAAAIGRATKKQRGRRSALWLEQRTAELGLKMTRQAVADLESGRRRFVTTAELLVLAAALDTTPIALMYSDLSDEPENVIEVLPGVEVTGFQAAQWVSGHRRGFIEEKVGDADAAEHDMALLHGWRKLDDLHRRLDRIAAPKNGRLVAEELALVDFYTTQIETLRRLLRLSDRNSSGVEDHA